MSDLTDNASLYDPNTGEWLAVVRSSSPSQVDRAIAAAARAHDAGEWLGLGIDGRAPFLLAVADELDNHAERIAHLDSLNSGVPISTTRLFANSNGDTVRSAVRRMQAWGDSYQVSADGRLVEIHRIPWGATGLIMPWNAPSAMAVKKVSFALASGSTVVMKPSPASPWSAQIVAEACSKVGIPDGVVNLVLGGTVVGHQLVADPRIRAISMTGSTDSGRSIAASAAPNFTRLRLELGSSNPAIVRADADIAQTATLIANGALKMSGQWCEAPRRIIADVNVVDELVDALEVSFAKHKVGSSLDESTDVGPVAFEARRDELQRQRSVFEQHGARIIGQNDIDRGGWFFAPTIAFGGEHDPGIEVFGPMITVNAARDDAEALENANFGQVGLAAYVFSRDESRAAALGKQLNAGEVKVNGTSVLDMSPDSAQSFFGSSGIGGHGDSDVLDFFIGKRIVGTDAPGLPL